VGQDEEKITFVAMNNRDIYMQRCLDLAKLGWPKCRPNPMVGSVIVYNRKIIGEGYHKAYGEGHAEVMAIGSVKDKSLLSQSTLYVNLEPCSHFGKTPPCADLIIEHKIPKVVIGTTDTTSKVAGKGIERLKAAGVDVTVDVLQKEARELNKRFLTFHEKKRPYIILKWAESSDGFIDKVRSSRDELPAKITGPLSQQLVHQWRAEEESILVGGNTVRLDNPQLNVRVTKGRNPLRIVISKEANIPEDSLLLIDGQPTLIYNKNIIKEENNLEYASIDFSEDWIKNLLVDLHGRGIQSILVEGGAMIHSAFLASNEWDEVRKLSSRKTLNEGIAAPAFSGIPLHTQEQGGDRLDLYFNV